MRHIHLIIVVALLSGRARADGMLISWSPSDLEGMTEVRWNTAKKQACKDVAPQNAKVTSWPEAYEVALGANANASCKEMLAALVAQITDRTVTVLTQTRRLIIWERITSGEILFVGKGIQIDDDLLTVGGRANWLLRTVMKKNFGAVTPGSTKEALAGLQSRWKKLLDGGTVAEVAEAYPTKEKGMSELRSPAAIEALIASLRPSAAKDAETAKCLRDIYKLTTMPTAPDSPARVCNPDFSANGFLKVITAVPDEHPHAWWAAWWKTNGTRLKWSSEKAKFLTP